jgi:hypothetical protein
LGGRDQGGPVLGRVLFLFGEGRRAGGHEGERVVEDVISPAQRANEHKDTRAKQALSRCVGRGSEHGHPQGQLWEYIVQRSNPCTAESRKLHAQSLIPAVEEAII